MTDLPRFSSLSRKATDSRERYRVVVSKHMPTFVSADDVPPAVGGAIPTPDQPQSEMLQISERTATPRPIESEVPVSSKMFREWSAIEPTVPESPDLPELLQKWPALPRYLVAELEQTGLLDRATAERVTRDAWHNATACGQLRKDFKA